MDYINNIYLKFINLGDRKIICFVTDGVDSLIYIICNDIEYEEII